MEAYEEASKPADGQKDLDRVLGVKSVVAMSLAAMTGTVLMLPGPAVSFTGSSATLAVFVSGICVLSAAFSKSEIATAMPVSGGSYVYLAKAFGPMFGTMAGFGLWMSLLFKGAFGLAGVKMYLWAMVGKDTISEWWMKAISLGLLAVMLAGNLMGLKIVKVAQKYVTLFVMVFLVFVIFGSFATFDDTAYREHFMEDGATGFIECLGFVFMGYAGLTKVCALASEIKDPGRTMPQAVLFSLAVFTPFFMLAVNSCLGNIEYEYLKKDYSPFYTVAEKVGGKWLANIVGVCCILTMASLANVALAAVARFPYAMAQDGLLPPTLALIAESTDAPYISLLLSSGVMALSLIFLPVKQIAKLCSAYQLIIFILVDVSLIIFRVHDEYWYKPDFKSPLFPYMQIFGMVMQTVMLVYMGMEGSIATGCVMFVGFFIYYFYGQHHAKFIGVIPFEKCFNIEPERKEPIKPHKERHHEHPMTEQDFETEIWEYEEDLGLPHEAHILQVEQLEQENLNLKQENRRLKMELERWQKGKEAEARRAGSSQGGGSQGGDPSAGAGAQEDSSERKNPSPRRQQNFEFDALKESDGQNEQKIQTEKVTELAELSGDQGTKLPLPGGIFDNKGEERARLLV